MTASTMTLDELRRPVSRREAMEAFLTQHAFRLLQAGGLTPVNHEAVAVAAAVSARTVYRYFPSQDDLVAAVWKHVRDSTGTVWPESEDAIVSDLRMLFEQFERHDSLTRAVIAASSRINISVPGSAEGRAAFGHALADRLRRMPLGEANALVATCVAIYSAPFWQMLRDRGQLSADAAIAAACTAMRAVLAAADAADAERSSRDAES
jgi:AcrR family transcriptional regulator